MNRAKRSRAVRGIVGGAVLVTALVGCTDDGDSGDAGQLPSETALEEYVEATASFDVDRLEAAREIVQPGSPADGIIDYYLALMDYHATVGQPPEPLVVQETNDGWRLCSEVEDVASCVEVSAFEGDDGKLVTYDYDGVAIDDTLLVGDGTPAAEGAWGSVTLRIASVNDIDFFALVDIHAEGTTLSVRNGEVGFRTVDGDDVDADMDSSPTAIEPGDTVTLPIYADTADLSGEITVPVYGEDGEPAGNVTVPIGD